MTVRAHEDGASPCLLYQCLHLLAEHMLTNNYCMHVTNPFISSSTRTLSILEIAEEEYTLIETLFLDSGIKQWSLRVPGIAHDCLKRCSRRICSLL